MTQHPLEPLSADEPEGASFTVEGAELKWQNWTMRLGFNYREGPVIYQVTFDDHGTVRDIAYRLSFAEMIVPYRDPTFDHYRRLRHWRMGAGSHDPVPRTRLRLPGRGRVL